MPRAEQGSIESELAKLQEQLWSAEVDEVECESEEEVEVESLRSLGAGSLSADGSRTQAVRSTGTEGPIDLLEMVTMLAQSQMQMAAKLEKGFQKIESAARKASRLTDESKIIDGVRNQGEFNRYLHLMRIVLRLTVWCSDGALRSKFLLSARARPGRS
jgi:hypothetical protein